MMNDVTFSWHIYRSSLLSYIIARQYAFAIDGTWGTCKEPLSPQRVQDSTCAFECLLDREGNQIQPFPK
jgi:hypothetical protein